MNKISIKNKIVAIILSVSMIVSLVPSFSLTFTAETDGEAPVCTCGTENDTHAVDCALSVTPEPVVCPTCGVTGCTSTHENWCDTCEKDDCGVDHTITAPELCPNCNQEVCTCPKVELCQICGAENCETEHVYCETCQKYDCGVDHNTESQECPTCGVVGCTSTHENWCDICKIDDCGVNHNTESQECPTCGAVGCTSTYENWCDTCKIDNCGVDHNSESQNTPDINILTSIEPRYAKITAQFPWIYIDPVNSSNAQIANATLLPEIVVIVDECMVDGINYYRIDAADGYTWPEDYSQAHYIKSSDVQEIIVEDDVCNICGKDNCNIEHVYCEICEKYDCGLNHTDDGFNTVYVDYSGITSSGMTTKITAPEGSFPDGTVMTVADTFVAPEQVQSVISDNILGTVAIDISFGGNQPSNKVAVYWDIPYDKIPQKANRVFIVHMGSNGPEIVGEKYLNTSDFGESLAFTADSFSSYAAVFVNGKYVSQKMSDILADNSRYSIYDGIKIDLFDYDPVDFNASLNAATSDNNGFHLTGYGVAGCSSNNGINNSAAENAKQGIVASNLDATTKLPIINYLNGENAGKTTGEILFSDTYNVNGKTIYKDVPFEVIYDNVTGFYQYKSAVNHAQLNDAGNKIELYADTLSTQNVYVKKFVLDSYISSKNSDIKNVEASANSFKGTATDANSNDRHDPYFHYAVEKIATSSVDKIYVKMKVPANIGANLFAIYFTTSDTVDGATNENASGYSENQVFKYNYTATGDWIEIVIDTMDRSDYSDDGIITDNWTGKYITGIRIDPFDYGKEFMTSDTEFEILEIAFISDSDQYATRGGFYPFSEIQDSYPGNNTAFNISDWETALLDDAHPYKVASRAIYNPSPNPSTDLYDELAYGVVMEFDFYLPVNRTGGYTYYFNGDDDLWVFVDGKLALDIGGGHGAITGTLDFTTGAMTVENAIQVTGYNSNSGNASSVSGQMDASMYSPGKHTMKIFYLERGGSVSNCFMKFNLPTTPQGSVVVSKDVRENNNANNDVLINSEFEFKISIQNSVAGEYQQITPLVNEPYYIVGLNGESLSGITDENGMFTLKSGQKAYFDIDEYVLVTVEEQEKIIVDHKWISTIVNDNEGRVATGTTVKDNEIRFSFVNIYERLYGNLKIIKKGISPIDHNSEETQSSIFTIVGQTSIGESINIEVVIGGNESIVINDLPVGQYTVTENTDWSWRYDPTAYQQLVTVEGGETAETSFENNRNKIYWLSGDSYLKNRWSTEGIKKFDYLNQEISN